MWIKGHISPIWDTSFTNFNYQFKPVPNFQIEKWQNSGYNHTSFNGTMFNNQKLMPDWCFTIAKKFNLSNPGFVFYKMKTNDIMPVHIDHYENYCKIFNVDASQVWRLIIFLENWKSGHYFEIDNNAIVNWSSGDYVFWKNNVPHAASNIGLEPRYTLQITGIVNDIS